MKYANAHTFHRPHAENGTTIRDAWSFDIEDRTFHVYRRDDNGTWSLREKGLNDDGNAAFNLLEQGLPSRRDAFLAAKKIIRLAKREAEAKAKAEIDLAIATDTTIAESIEKANASTHDECVSQYVTGHLYQIAGRLFTDDGELTPGQKERLEVLILDVLSDATKYDPATLDRLEKLAVLV